MGKRSWSARLKASRPNRAVRLSFRDRELPFCGARIAAEDVPFSALATGRLHSLRYRFHALLQPVQGSVWLRRRRPEIHQVECVAEFGERTEGPVASDRHSVLLGDIGVEDSDTAIQCPGKP